MRQPETEVLCTTCCLEKQPTPTPLPASELYLDERIGAVLAEGQRLSKAVLILSGKFGLVRPEDRIPWYDHALRSEEVDELVPQLVDSLRISEVRKIRFYALPVETPGWRPYHEALERACWQLGIAVEHSLPPGVQPIEATAIARQLAERGYARVPAALDPQEIQAIQKILSEKLLTGHSTKVSSGGVRHLLQRSKAILQLFAQGNLWQIAKSSLGEDAHPVQATLFDKTPGANWKVPFHQDLTIAVQKRREAKGFGPWSIKEGVPHVQAPAAILDAMVALRLHLDDCPADHGALRVIPRSHRLGRLPQEDISQLRRGHPEVFCAATAGDVWLMKPLLFHASSPSQRPTHRRVLHVDYTSARLPAGLSWTG